MERYWAEDVSQAVADFLRDEGVDVRVDSKVIGVEKQGNSIGVKVESAGKISQVVGTHVLGCAFVEGHGHADGLMGGSGDPTIW
jgi:NADPH-dependent 2,4-dienoyl-CoA reductase/sulfur reductase-like enzyme